MPCTYIVDIKQKLKVFQRTAKNKKFSTDSLVEIQVVALKIVEYCTVGNFCGFKFSRNRPKFGFQKFSRF